MATGFMESGSLTSEIVYENSVHSISDHNTPSQTLAHHLPITYLHIQDY